jgi:hypothetical protein
MTLSVRVRTHTLEAATAPHAPRTRVALPSPHAQLPEGNRLYGLAALLPHPLAIADAGLVVQYEVRL